MISLPFCLRPLYVAAPKGFVVRFDATPARLPDLAPEAIVLVACVRNEMIRLAQFLDHYRRIGVDHFAIVDNASTDGTAEWLEQQIDVSLYRTSQSYAAAGCGWAWVETLLDRHAAGRWCLVADADELLVYPGYPERSLSDMVAYHDAHGFGAMASVMLDMYAATLCPQADSVGSLFDQCPYYDSDGMRVVCRVLLDRPQDRIVGGFRQRVLGTRVLLNKVAFFQRVPGVRLSTGNHAVVGTRCSDVRAAHLHFKYLADFRERVLGEIARGEHWNGASEYRSYARALGERQTLDVLYDGSRRWSGSRPLVDCGVMRSSERFERFFSRGSSPEA
jgi:glycosyltransferase involved in cell wall biosynthesis